MIFLQLCLYCLLFTAMVRYSVRGGAINGLYFYPKAVQERAYEIGLTGQGDCKKAAQTLYDVVLYRYADCTGADHRRVESCQRF